MAERGLRLPDAGFEVILRILKAYLAAARNQAGVSVRLDDLVKRAGGSRSQISGQNAFLVSLGLISGGNAKELTELGRQVALAADSPDLPEWRQGWGEALEHSDDLVGVIDSVRIRREMTADDLISHIVLTAGVAKNSRSITGARTVIEVLKAAGSITESDGTFRAADRAQTTEPSDWDSQRWHTTVEGGRPQPHDVDPPGPNKAPARPEAVPARQPVTIHIHVWINDSDDPTQDVGEKVKAIVDNLALGDS